MDSSMNSTEDAACLYTTGRRLKNLMSANACYLDGKIESEGIRSGSVSDWLLVLVLVAALLACKISMAG